MTINMQLIWAMAMFSFVTSITPGPNNMMLLSSGVNFGLRRTLPHVLGISTGFFLMLLAVGAGLGKVFQEAPVLYQIMKVAGFAYLVYLAWCIANSGAPIQSNTSEATPLSFVGAALFQWVNPKAWMMAVGYFSSYIPNNSSKSFIFFSCLMFGLINFPTCGIWAVIGNKLEQRLQNQSYRKVFNMTMAALLVLSMLPVLFI
jgi:threonine/homoserine/homoserine lactone efflux protein